MHAEIGDIGDTNKTCMWIIKLNYYEHLQPPALIMSSHASTGNLEEITGANTISIARIITIYEGAIIFRYLPLFLSMFHFPLALLILQLSVLQCLIS